MSSWIRRAIGAAVALGALASAPALAAPCGTTVTYTPVGALVAPQRPTPRVVVRPLAPTTAHVWVDGQWGWSGVQWVWSPGYWRAPAVQVVHQPVVYTAPRTTRVIAAPAPVRVTRAAPVRVTRPAPTRVTRPARPATTTRTVVYRR